MVLGIQGPWVFGALMNTQWSFAGRGDKNVNAMLLQPFVNYNMPGGWFLTSSSVMTANWKADSGNRWTVPLGGSIGKLFKLCKLLLNTQLQAFGYVERPKFASGWSLRFQIQFLFPK